MKKLLPLFVLIFAVSAFSQATVKPTPEKEQSKIEVFSARSGSLLERQFIPVGEVRGVRIQIYKLTDLLSKIAVTGVRFEMDVSSTYSTDTKIAVLDADEVDALIKSVEALKTIFTTTRETYTEITYRSRSGFEAGAYFSKTKWTPYLKLERFDSKSIVFMGIEEFDQLLTVLNLAKNKMI